MSFGVGIGDFIAVSKLIKSVVDCLKESGGSASVYNETVGELVSLRSALDAISELQVSVDREDALKAVKVAALNCHFVLQAYLEKLEKYGLLAEDSGDHRIRRSLKKIQWAAEMKNETIQLRGYIAAHTNSLNMRLITEGLRTFSLEAERADAARLRLESKVDRAYLLVEDVKTDIYGVSEKLKEVLQAKFMDRLSVLDFKQRQNDIFSRRQDDTGEWILSEPAFIKWRNGDGPTTLFCPGDAGSGKTTILAILVEYLSALTREEGGDVAFVYCDYNDRERQTASAILGSIIRQLSFNNRVRQQRVQSLLTKCDEARIPPSLVDYQSLLVSFAHTSQEVFILIDALDELSPNTREALLPVFSAISHTSTRLLVTSRSFSEDIKLHFRDVPQTPIIAMEHDIRLYLQTRIEKNDKFMKRLNSKLYEHVVESITSNAHGMFLLAVLQLERIFRERTTSKISKALRLLPSELDKVYKDTFERIRNQGEPDSSLAWKVLSYISFTFRPLTVAELTHALAIDWDDTQSSPPVDFDEDNILDPETLVDVCGGLVLLENNGADVRFVHPTLEEYIRGHGAELFPDAHFEIAKSCISCLSFSNLGNNTHCTSSLWIDSFAGVKIFNSPIHTKQGRFPSEHTLHVLETYRFLDYCVGHWIHHFSRVADERLDAYVLKLLHERPNLLSIPHVVGLENRKHPSVCGATPFHIAAQLGVRRIVRALLDTGNDPAEAHPLCGMNSLHIAACYGSDSIIDILAKHVDPESCDQLGRRPIHWAADYGHASVVRELISCGASINVMTSRVAGFMHFSTPLHFAARNGFTDIVQVLLDNQAETEIKMPAVPRLADQTEHTPLGLAMKYNKVGAARLLLEMGSAQMPDNSLSGFYGARMHNGFVDMVKLLLEHGVDPNKPDEYQRAPMIWACKGQKSKLVKLLLDFGADSERPDRRGNTPLCYACENDDDTVEILCKHGANVHSSGWCKMQPLHFAARGGTATTGEILIQHGANVNATNDVLDTPLLTACELIGYSERNCFAVIDTLCQYGADTNAKNIRGETSLHSVAYAVARNRGNTMALPLFEAIFQLLCKKGADVNSQDSKEKTALHIVASEGLISLVTILLSYGANPNLADERGKTALHSAALHGYESIAEALLKYGADVGVRDKLSRTAFELAIENKRQGIVRMLAESFKGFDGYMSRHFQVEFSE